MIGRQNIAVRGNDHARAEALRLVVARPLLPAKLLPEKAAQQRVLEKRVGQSPLVNRHGRVNIHHARGDLPDHRRKADGRPHIAVDGGALNRQFRRGIGAALGLAAAPAQSHL